MTPLLLKYFFVTFNGFMSHKMEDRQGVINRADKGVFLNSLPSYNNQERTTGGANR